ncbi:FAD:protein FMN transferase, partial [bacterium]|nr:FAD:protein FMN transferase [bacterium]
MRRLISRLFYIFLLVLSSASAETLTRTKVALGTFVSISADAKYSNAIEEAFVIINNVELALSSYNKNSPIYKLNQQKEAQLHPFTYEALLLSQKYY